MDAPTQSHRLGLDNIFKALPLCSVPGGHSRERICHGLCSCEATHEHKQQVSIESSANMYWPEENCYLILGLGNIHAVSGCQGRFHGGDGIWVGSEMMYIDIGKENQRGHF